MPHRANEKDKALAALTPPSADWRASASRPGGTPASDRFVPGRVFAARYRMVNRLGSSGMGEVWQADDLVLHTPVALKLIHSTTPAARERILDEVRVARQITHPALCRVFDLGEADEEIFYSMELIEGEDLAHLVRRAGHLPSERVVEIGQQLCAGLSAAHARGVLHRDLKPANVLVDRNGAVHITDFGMAAFRQEQVARAEGITSDYLAPEQLSSGGALSERTDVYAVGLILYELVVGQRPPLERSSRTTAVPKPSSLVPDVDRALEHAILKALAANPDNRPASASELAQLLTTAPPASSRWLWPWLGGAAAVIIAGMLLPTFLSRPERPLTEHDTIVLADFSNTTGEPVFDGALKVALAVALEQSPFLKVFPDERMRETLRLMQRPPDERVTRIIAREIAQRERLKALIAGSIDSIGSHYVLALEAVNASTGDVMAREQIEVPSKEQVLSSLGETAAKLREKLGESLSSVQRFAAPLPRATTASLDALHAYALALDQGTLNLRPEAVPHLQRAIELDPNFAMAHALLSAVYANIGRSADAPDFARKAFELRNRTSEREAFFISWRYYIDAKQSWDKALDLAESWTTTYPREAFAFNSLGLASVMFGQYERGLAAYREAIRVDPRFAPPYSNAVAALLALNRVDEAKSVFAQAAKNGVASNALRRADYRVAFLDKDDAAMRGALDRLRQTQGPYIAFYLDARAHAFGGRLREAHDLFQAGIQTALQDDFVDLASEWMVEDAEAHAVVGRCDEARREASAGLARARNKGSLERAGRVLALCGDSSQAATVSQELGSRFREATMTTRVHLPLIAAGEAFQRNDNPRTIALLKPLAPYDHVPGAELWSPYLRGQAYLRLKDGQSAAVQFDAILASRGQEPESPLHALAYLGRARAAVLTGETDVARKAYAAFLSEWQHADPDLQPLVEARREQASLN